ncbi:CD74 molecule, major histocompatibility complex, class II invariant chain a isoform X2 [Takifugu rubripes]|uniref:CD74 molecule, major histocompatibility complex, class II invariant chain a n=1 Tax=Takifugu rubripes TaxID=31033 RepID=H2SNE4_TAKRU|nr:HLA class II histocompatibility antigen gamma chain isoform X1 [Takifugu rubripes]XP_029702872.1 HLA class II histocompatibility antigen gamma chain isoform X2 [Takifugu rubripes]|eukprot:XP_003970400.1 PREDICTED: HLA class II histocompatibility antigen gamma chain [Takifugu rubripes]
MSNTGDAPLARGSVAGSEDALILRTRPEGGSNRRALKVAGLTTLACLLLGSQVFTAYMVFGQNQQIKALQSKNENMNRQLTRSNQAPVRVQMPMKSLPMMRAYDPDSDPKPVAPKAVEKKTVVSVETQVKDLLQDFKLPLFNSTFIPNLLALKQQMNETVWEEFESWMQFWLIFQMAQEKAPLLTATTAPAKTKCQEEAAAAPHKLGAHKPQCDEQGQYKPIQCWHAVGFCWCVDSTGAPIQGTAVRGRPDCPKAASYGRMMIAPLRELAAVKVGDE